MLIAQVQSAQPNTDLVVLLGVHSTVFETEILAIFVCCREEMTYLLG